jgi:hypothetical protein
VDSCALYNDLRLPPTKYFPDESRQQRNVNIDVSCLSCDDVLSTLRSLSMPNSSDDDDDEDLLAWPNSLTLPFDIVLGTQGEKDCLRLLKQELTVYCFDLVVL